MIKKALELFNWLQRTRPMRANTHLGERSGAVLTAGMAYQTLFAVFGALWVGFSLFGIYLQQHPDLLDTILQQLDASVPGLFGDGGLVDVRQLLEGSGLTWSSVISAAALIPLIINWFAGMRVSIRLIFQIETVGYRHPVLMILRDFGFAVVFGILILLSSTLTLVVGFVLGLVLPDAPGWGIVGQIVSAILSVGMYWVVLWGLHKLLAEVPVPAKRLWLGTLPGAIAMLVLMMLGTRLLGGATNNPLLASVAVLVGMLIWFNLVNKIILFTSSFIAVGEDKSLGMPKD